MTDLKAQLEAALANRGAKRQGKEIHFRCPAHNDEHASADYNPAKGVWICRACGESGNYWNLAHLLGLVTDGHRPDGFQETRRWDNKGRVHKRFEKPGEKKQVLWEKDGELGLKGEPVSDLPLYGIDNVIDLDRDVLVSEGEKAADSLTALGFQSAGTVTGAASIPSKASLLPLAKHRGRIILCQDNDDPGRNHMNMVAARLRSMGKLSYILAWPGVEAKGDAYDFIKAGHGFEDIQKIIGSSPEYSGESEPSRYNLTDLGNAERFVSQHGVNLRYSAEREKWLVWNGKCWVWNDEAEVWSLAKGTVRRIYAEASQEDDDQRRAEVAKWAKSSESISKLKGMVELASKDSAIQVQMADLDRNPWVLNCSNGTIDLRTGTLHPHRREDLQTMIIDTPFDSCASAPIWEQFLNHVTANDPSLIQYLQKIIGYSLTGDTRAQCLFFLHGRGCNGKSTLVDVIHKLLGPYALKADISMFMSRDYSGGITEGLANLAGKRFVIASEIEDGQKLAVSLVKDITGCEPIRANRKYEHEIEFRPTFKLWLSGNHQPSIWDTTHSIWRRIKQIPFTVTIEDANRDDALPGKLEKEFPGILAWAIHGCLLWQKEGLAEPSCVLRATSEYRRDQDVLADFISDRCKLTPTVSVSKKALYDEYLKWCNEEGTKPVGQKTFGTRLKDRGILDRKSGSIRLWQGITISQMGQFGTNGADGTGIPKSFPHEELQGKVLENDVPSVPSVPNVPEQAVMEGAGWF